MQTAGSGALPRSTMGPHHRELPTSCLGVLKAFSQQNIRTDMDCCAASPFPISKWEWKWVYLVFVPLRKVVGWREGEEEAFWVQKALGQEELYLYMM